MSDMDCAQKFLSSFSTYRIEIFEHKNVKEITPATARIKANKTEVNPKKI